MNWMWGANGHMWERLWGLITQPDPTIWAGIIGFGGALIAGWLGGRLAVKAALLGAEKAHKDNLRLAAQATQSQTIAFVQAIRTEFGALYHFVSVTISPEIAQIGVGKPLEARFVLGEDYFTIYRANASLLGNVDDAEVRDAIVRGYMRAQDFIDTIRTNNTAAQESSLWESQPWGPEVYGRRAIARTTLETLANGVVNTHSAFIDAHAKLFEKTEAWLRSKGAMASTDAQ